jgi:hypothetical protein
MRIVILFALPSLLSAQFFSFGVKGGLPVTAASDAGRLCGRFFCGTTDFLLNRYTVGPTIEIKLPWAVRLEVDGLYKHVREDAYGGPFPTSNYTFNTSHANIWEIPMLLKHRFGKRALSPYAAVGGALRHIGDVREDFLSVPDFPGYPSQMTHFTRSPDPSLMSGWVVAGGVSVRTRFIRIEPELRFTHWTSSHFLATTEQVEFLVGFTFPWGFGHSQD